MAHEFTHPVIGQQAVVYPDGNGSFLGMVVTWKDDFPYQHIRVRHPVTKVECNYAPSNVQLVPIGGL